MNYYVIDSFTSEIFKGNPAGVCILEEKLSDELMQKIASENNLPETAFVYKQGERYLLRWFTPSFEINLCGHATLAAAYVICTHMEPARKLIEFETLSGILTVIKKDHLYEMTFPKLPPKKIGVTPEFIRLLGFEPLELYSERDLYIIVENENAVRSFTPNYEVLKQFEDWLGIVITAKGTDVDFVSRYFCPELLLEDPVTGSTHSSLIPLWSQKLQKDALIARQLSQRGGTLFCQNASGCVKISGEAMEYMSGHLNFIK